MNENSSWIEEYKAGNTSAAVLWHYPHGGGVDLTFRVTATGKEETRHYKTYSAAKGAATKFFHRVGRIWK